MTRLGLHGTKIRDTGLNEVAKLKQLEHLFLGDSKVTKAWRGVAELKKTLPQCETIHLAKK